MQEQTPPPSSSSVASTSQDASAGAMRPSIISPRAIRARSRSLGPVNTMSPEDVEAARRASMGRVLDVWASLAERYGHVALDADDEIDISTGQVVRDRGVIRRLRESKPIGGRVEESEDSVSSDDGEDDSEDELGRLYDEPPAPAPAPSFRGPSVARDPQRDEQELRQFLQDEQMRKRNAIILPDGSTETVSETGSEARASTTPDDLEPVAGPSISRAPSTTPAVFDTSDESEDYDSHDELALVDDPPDTPFTSPVKATASASAANNKFSFLTPPRSQSADPRRPVDRVAPLLGQFTLPRHSPVSKLTAGTRAVATTPGRPRLEMEVVLPRRSELMGPPSSTPRRPSHAHRLSGASSTSSSSEYPDTPTRSKTQYGSSRVTALPSPAPTDSSVRNSDSVEEIDLGQPRPFRVYGRKSLSRSNSVVLSSNRHNALPTPPPLYSSSPDSSSSRSKSTGLPTPSTSSTPSRFDGLSRPPIPVPLPARARDFKGKSKAAPPDDPPATNSSLASDTDEESGHDAMLLSSPLSSPVRLPPTTASHDDESSPPPRIRSPARPRTNSSSPRKRRRSAGSADEARQRENPPSPTKRRTMESSRNQSPSSSRAGSSRPQQQPPPHWPHHQLPAGMPLFANGHGFPGPNANANLVAQFITGVQQMSVLAQAVMPGLFVQQPPPPGALPMLFGMPGGGGFGMQHQPPPTPIRHQQQQQHRQHSSPSSPRPRSQSPARSRSILRTPSSSRVRKRVSFLLERERSASLDGDDVVRPNDDDGAGDTEDDDHSHRRGREKLRVKGTPAPGNGRRGWSQDR